jgi:hypothetical protein
VETPHRRGVTIRSRSKGLKSPGQRRQLALTLKLNERGGRRTL